MSTERYPLFVDANAMPGQPGWHEYVRSGDNDETWSVTLDGVEMVGKEPYVVAANALEGWIEVHTVDWRRHERVHGKVIIEYKGGLPCSHEPK